MGTVNPKMEGTPLIDAVPQSGPCPLKCRACYFNLGFYRDTPFVPTAEEAEGKIVRVCSGNDANNQRELVIEATAHLSHKYYCTAIPTFGFGGPAVFTCNRDENQPPTLVGEDICTLGYDARLVTDDLMSVRFRYTPWNQKHLKSAIKWYCETLGTPLLITPMRYYDVADIPEEHRDLYVFKKHLVHSYYMLKAEVDGSLRTVSWGHRLAYICAGLCRDCLLCVHFYRQVQERWTR